MHPPASTSRTLVIGAGSWGTALAATATYNSQTLLYARNAQQAEHINQHHKNPHYIRHQALPPSLRATDTLVEAIAHLRHDSEQSLIVLAVPVLAMREVSTQWFSILQQHGLSHIPIVWSCKGFEQSTGLLPHEVMQNTGKWANMGVISGPSFAQEVLAQLPVALTVASQQILVKKRVTAIFHNHFARIYRSDDVIGVEVGGALKNIIAIACGISDGLSLGNNARAALITRGLAEMTRLGTAMGAEANTFSGLTGLGDLILTATGDLSRNRQVGIALGKGQLLDDILSSGITAEGVRCAKDTLARAKHFSVDMPITHTICQVLFKQKPPIDAVKELLSRESKEEYI